VTVLNGNLSFVGQPLMIGHTRSLSLTGTEAVLNGLLGGAMKASLRCRALPRRARLAADLHQFDLRPPATPGSRRNRKARWSLGSAKKAS
jgi:hypothetical protein